MLVGFKTKLNLNNKQRTLAAKHAGTARHAWNWGLDICLKVLDAKEKLDRFCDRADESLVDIITALKVW